MRQLNCANLSAYTRRPWAFALALIGFLLIALANVSPPGPALAQDDEAREDAAEAKDEGARRGRLIRVPLPITGNVDRRVVQQIRRSMTELKPAAGAADRPTLVLEFDVGQTEFGRGSEFEDSLKLARFLVSSELDGVRTVAFLPDSIKGHAVLVAIACEQIIMAPDAEIGDAGAGHDDENPIDATIVGGYEQIARSRHTVPVEIALGMLDAQRELLRVETEDGPQLVFAADLPQLRETKTIDDDKTQVLFAAGESGILNSREARDLAVANFLASERGDVAAYLGLPRKAMKVDPFLEGDVRARMVRINGYIDARAAETRAKMIDDAIQGARANLLCLWLESSGGEPEAAAQLAALLAQQNSEDVLTVAYVPTEARGVAALLATACDDLVMLPDATLGGGEPGLSDEERLDVVALIEDEIAPSKSRSPSLLAAMFKDDLPVYQYKHRGSGLQRFASPEEIKEQADAEQWERGRRVNEDGEPLEVDGNEAEDLDLASAVVENFAEFKKEYGLEDDPYLAEPTWVDTLVRALASPGLAWLLLMIGMAGMYAEVQMPGIGVGGFVAAVAFTLYFWANFLEGTAGALEIVLFLVGIACVVMEVFILPGFGIFGLGGGVMILVSLVLASQTFILPSGEGQIRELRDSLLVVGGAVVGLVGISMVMRRYLPHTPFLNRLLLPPPEGEALAGITQREAMANYDHLLSQRGTTTTQLTPSGKARFGVELVDVVSDGDLIPVNSEIEVVAVHGNRVVVTTVG